MPHTIERQCKKNSNHKHVYEYNVIPSGTPPKGSFGFFTSNPYNKKTVGQNHRDIKPLEVKSKYGLKHFEVPQKDPDESNSKALEMEETLKADVEKEKKFLEKVDKVPPLYNQPKKPYSPQHFFSYKNNSDQTIFVLPMKIISECNLNDFIAKNENLSDAQKYEIAISLTRSLMRVHQAGIIHRDIKPGNVMVKKNEDNSLTAILIDFGLSIDADKNDNQSVGSFLYASPEVFSDSPKQSAKSDVYSLAIVIYELFTGNVLRGGRVSLPHLYTGDLSRLAKSAILQQHPSLNMLLKTMLDKNDTERPTPEEILASLAGMHVEYALNNKDKVMENVEFDEGELNCAAELADKIKERELELQILKLDLQDQTDIFELFKKRRLQLLKYNIELKLKDYKNATTIGWRNVFSGILHSGKRTEEIAYIKNILNDDKLDEDKLKKEITQYLGKMKTGIFRRSLLKDLIEEVLTDTSNSNLQTLSTPSA